MDKVRFILLEDGQEKPHIISKPLLTIPGTGDVIVDPVGTEKFKVESVVHSNVFGDPGDHTVTVYFVKI